VQIFKAFFIANASEKNYEKVIKLFFQRESIKDFDLNFVKNINPCWDGVGRKRNAFIYLLKNINALNSKGNLNKQKYFLVFLQRSIRSLYQLGYDNQIDPWMIGDIFSMCNNADEEFVTSLLIEIDKRIQKYIKEFETYPNVLEKNIEELKVISEFINKMLSVIHMEKEIVDYGLPNVTTTIKMPSAEIFARLHELTDNEFERELEKEKDNLIPYKIAELLRQRKNS
jgi:hypothetical protein